MKKKEELPRCQNCGNPIDDCKCVCPYCGESIEDAGAGIEAARRAGMRSIGIRRPGSELEAGIVVARLDELSLDAFDRLIPS